MEEWLTSIGLASHVTAFREQGITLDQFADLTEEDLRELGLTIGERKRFRRALANQAKDTPVATIIGQASRAERRPLTVMFVDLMDSTGLGERLDPEDLLEVIRRYREFCGNAIIRFGGHIARFLGDGILAYFCYPVANENDPERAIRAALEIAHGIGASAIPSVGTLQVRIGIATGRVIIGDLFSGGEIDKKTIIGSTPNLAARLQTLAAANGVVISEETHDKVEMHFACESLGPVPLRGFDEPLHAWRVISERSQQGQSDHRLIHSHATSFHGRKSELDTLRVLWTKAERGDGAVALVTGEAGIGKSRLVENFLDVHLPKDVRVIRLAASAFDEDSPLRPFTDCLRAMAGLVPADTPENQLAKIEAILSGDQTQRSRASAVLAGILGIPVTNPSVAELLPPQLRERTIVILVEQFLGLAAERSLCLVLEDLHWLDPTSREFLDLLVSRISRHRFLLLLTAREGLAPEWMAKADITLRLRRLAPKHVAAMMHELFGERSILAQLIAQVTEKTDGVPLFVEEVTRVLLQTVEGWEEVIPASLEESLMARLDRLGTAKEIAQAAAVVGRSTRRDVLEAVCSLGPDKLDEALRTLVESGVLERIIDLTRESYTFHHALLRDAAYSSLLRDQRKDLNVRVARALQVLDPEGIALYPEVLAQHLTDGDLAEEAASYWLDAGRRSLARSALTEATRMLRRGLIALERLPVGEQTLRLRLEFSALLGPALIGLKGPNSAETNELYSTAYELCRQLPEEQIHFPVYWGWWRLEPANLNRAAALLDRAIARNDPELMLQAHHCSWASHLNVGSFDRCCEHIEAGLAIYHKGDYTHHARLYGNHDAKVCAHGNLSQLYWMQGKLKSALREETQCLSWAEKIDHLGSHLQARGMTLLHRVFRRDHEEVFRRSGALISFTSDHGLAQEGSAALIFRGWVMATEGEPVVGLKMIEEGLARQRDVATHEDFPVYLCLLSEVLTTLGKPDMAVDRITSERPDFDRSNLRFWMPELLRVLGDTMLAADPASAAKARRTYAEAAELAQAQGVPMLGLRIAISEARLELRLGELDEAARRVASALGRIVEGDGSVELTEAHELVKRINEKADLGP